MGSEYENDFEATTKSEPAVDKSEYENDFEATAKSEPAVPSGYEDDFEGSASGVFEGNPDEEGNGSAKVGDAGAQGTEKAAAPPQSGPNPTQEASPKANFAEYEDDEFEDDPE